MPKVRKYLSHLNFNRSKSFSVVDANHRPDHLRHDNHVSKMGLNNVRLLVHRGLLLGLAQLAEKRRVLAGKTARETTADTGTITIVSKRTYAQIDLQFRCNEH